MGCWLYRPELATHAAKKTTDDREYRVKTVA